jgi:hypothetical protein
LRKKWVVTDMIREEDDELSGRNDVTREEGDELRKKMSFRNPGRCERMDERWTM